MQLGLMRASHIIWNREMVPIMDAIIGDLEYLECMCVEIPDGIGGGRCCLGGPDGRMGVKGNCV